jgi:molybdopterin adenylyltransferase
MSRVVAVCRSEKKGTTKDVVPEVVLKEDYGVENDAHADSATHRQVSLLATESIKKMRDLGLDVGPGDFAENITTEGIELFSFKPGTRLSVGQEVTLEITQIGKECHSGCAILKLTGKCIMPKEGVFARVVRGGVVRAGDTIQTTH